MAYKASIIIPTYNRSRILDYTLNSILRQEMDISSIEVIVVDDGSSDDTGELVAEYSERMNLKYLYQADKGNRVSRARNMGIENAKSDILIFIDSGVLLASNCVSEHIKMHEQQSSPCAVLGYVYGFDQYMTDTDVFESLIDVRDPDQTVQLLRESHRFADMRERYYEKYNYQLNNLPAPWAFFVTCNVSVNRSALELSGTFDELFDLRWGVEDMELGYRLYENFVPILINRSAESVHYPHDHDMTGKFDEEVINKQLFYAKHKAIEVKLFIDSTFAELNDEILKYYESNNVPLGKIRKYRGSRQPVF
jgi:glycosyltransferase involved in cell wall biosynthesis